MKKINRVFTISGIILLMVILSFHFDYLHQNENKLNDILETTIIDNIKLQELLFTTQLNGACLGIAGSIGVVLIWMGLFGTVREKEVVEEKN